MTRLSKDIINTYLNIRIIHNQGTQSKTSPAQKLINYKAFKNRLEEMAEATVNALDYSDSKVEYPDISMVQKWPKK